MAVGLTPEALQEIRYAAYDEIVNKRKPYIFDRKAMPWLSFVMKRNEVAGATGGVCIVKLQRSGGMKIEHWDGRQVLTFSESRVDDEMRFEYRRNHLGQEILHAELEDMGYVVTPNAARGRNFAKATSQAEGFRIMDIFAQKIDGMMDDYDVDFDEILLRDGTQDPLAPLGLDAYMPLVNTTGTIGGKNRSDPLFQHQAILGSTVSAGGTLERDLNALTRRAHLNNRGMSSMVDFIMAGADWIDAYVNYCKNNNMRYDHPLANGAVRKLDIGIPDSAIFFNGTPIIHNPTFENLDAKGAFTGTRWTKRAYGLASKTWKLFTPPGKNKEFSAPMDPPDQRFTRMSLDGRHVLVPLKPSGNWVNTVA